MRARTFFVIFLAAAFALGTVTCGLAQSKKPLKIGAIFSVTGPAAFLGDPEKKTVQMMVKQINDAGGVNGFPLEVIVEDDEGKEPKAVAAAEKLISKDMVLAVIGPSLSGNSMAIKEIMQKSKEMGMQTFDMALFDLYEAGLVTYEDAMRNADSMNELRLRIKLEGAAAKGRTSLANLEGSDNLSILGDGDAFDETEFADTTTVPFPPR